MNPPPSPADTTQVTELDVVFLHRALQAIVLNVAQLDDKAVQLLEEATDLKVIQRILNFFPVRHNTTVLQHLGSKWNTRLATVYSEDVELKPLRDILFSQRSPSAGMKWDFRWVQRLTEPSKDTRAAIAEAATAIDDQFHLAIQYVPFSELVRVACGQQSQFVTALINGVLETREQLLGSVPSQLYIELTDRLLTPFGQWMRHSGIDSENPLDPGTALSPICDQIKLVFARRSSTVLEIVEDLEILCEVHRQKIKEGDNLNWSNIFAVDLWFVTAIRESSISDIASIILAKDKSHFDGFSVRKAQSRELDRPWTILSQTVTACCVVRKDYVPHIINVVEHLLLHPDFFGATALIIGLTNAGVQPAEECFWKLIDSTNNYQFYRAMWSLFQGLPWLHPHLCHLGSSNMETSSRYIDHFDNSPTLGSTGANLQRYVNDNDVWIRGWLFVWMLCLSSWQWFKYPFQCLKMTRNQSLDEADIEKCTRTDDDSYLEPVRKLYVEAKARRREKARFKARITVCRICKNRRGGTEVRCKHCPPLDRSLCSQAADA